MKLKPTCCRKFERKAKACRRCPLMAPLSRKKQKKELKRIRRRLARAA